VSPGHEHLICRLRKSLYGLKQSPMQWYRKFNDFVRSIGFLRSDEETPLVFYTSLVTFRITPYPIYICRFAAPHVYILPYFPCLHMTVLFFVILQLCCNTRPTLCSLRVEVIWPKSALDESVWLVLVRTRRKSPISTWTSATRFVLTSGRVVALMSTPSRSADCYNVRAQLD
jgi:hypothetical protein